MDTITHSLLQQVRPRLKVYPRPFSWILAWSIFHHYPWQSCPWSTSRSMFWLLPTFTYPILSGTIRWVFILLWVIGICFGWCQALQNTFKLIFRSLCISLLRIAFSRLLILWWRLTIWVLISVWWGVLVFIIDIQVRLVTIWLARYVIVVLFQFFILAFQFIGLGLAELFL